MLVDKERKPVKEALASMIYSQKISSKMTCVNSWTTILEDCHTTNEKDQNRLQISGFVCSMEFQF
jgi:hypothetical protein